MSDSFLVKSWLSARHGRRRYAADLKNQRRSGELNQMKKFLLATVALVALGATVPALAADLAARPVYTKAPAYAAPIYNWTGFYIGGHIGGALHRDNKFRRPHKQRKYRRFLRGVP